MRRDLGPRLLNSAVFVAVAMSVGCKAPSQMPGQQAEVHPPVDVEVVGDLDDRPAQVPSVAPVATTEHFEFYSRVELNLHHFLYQLAQAAAHREGRSKDRGPLTAADLIAFDALDPTDAAVWAEAVAFYRGDALSRDLRTDGTMFSIKRSLAVGSDPFEGVADGYADALRATLPSYRKSIWPRHAQSNRAWIHDALARLADHEQPVVRRLTAVYGGRWPDSPIRVDVCAYANWAGAYTSVEPPHIVSSSQDPEIQHDSVLELLFHEASHTPAMFFGVQTELSAMFEAQQQSEPSGLWHILIFLSAADAVNQSLAAAGVDGYVDYGERVGVYGRGPWAQDFKTLKIHWTSYLRSDIDRATALSRIVATVSAREP